MSDSFLQGHKYLWRLPAVEPQEALSVASAYALSIPIAQTLVQRGFAQPDMVEAFLFSSRDRDVALPAQMKDLENAARRIMHAIDSAEKILVFGDYDVDGITATSLVVHCLLALGAQVNFYLPNRMKDGYGLSAAIVERAAENGYSLIITVDNGITAYEAGKKAAHLGIDLIITDHHQAHEQIPEAYAVVNPNQKDCSYPCKDLAGVGVAFKVMSYIYTLHDLSLPNKVYELLALGTVADVVPLLGENRFWVRHGLQVSRASHSFFLKVLAQNAQIDRQRLTSHNIGYGLAPQLNALGRLHDPRQAVTFLLDKDEHNVATIGKKLFELNQARKEVEKTILDEVIQTIESGAIDLSREKVIIAASKTWPMGVIGLVASRLVGRYGLPTILLHVTKDGIAKGSCRSIPEFNIFQALQTCSDVLEKFGGHAQAAGLSVCLENIPRLKERLETLIAEQLTPIDLKQKLTLDACVTLPDVTKKFMNDLEHLQPFGQGNPEPIFYCKDVRLVQSPQLLKDAHVKCKVFADGIIKPLVFFNRPELFSVLKQCEQEGRAITCAVQVHENYWRDKVSIELIGIDVLADEKAAREGSV